MAGKVVLCVRGVNTKRFNPASRCRPDAAIAEVIRSRCGGLVRGGCSQRLPPDPRRRQLPDQKIATSPFFVVIELIDDVKFILSFYGQVRGPE
jgi:hypothetical protein